MKKLRIIGLLSVIFLLCCSCIFSKKILQGDRVYKTNNSVSGNIVFVDDPDSDSSDIFIVDAKGKSVTNLTNDNYDNANPVFSPDGRKIAFHSTRNEQRFLYVMNNDGTNPMMLLENSGYFDWSPDGNRIVAESRNRLHLLHTDGSTATIFENLPIEGFRSLSWSPDGTQILFVTSFMLGNNELYVINADGTNLTSLSWTAKRYQSPEWFPDSQEIVVIADNELTFVNRNGSNVRPLGLKMRGLDFIKMGVSWSPDGSHMMYYADELTNHRVFICNNDGTNPIEIFTNDIELDLIDTPSWSPDSKWIVFRAFPKYYEYETWRNVTELKILKVKTGKTYTLSSFGYSPNWGANSEN